MKTLDEVIDIMEHPLYGADDGFAEIAEDDIDDALYYLKAYKEMVDGIVNVIRQYKETFKMIIEDCEDENARRSDKNYTRFTNL